MAPAAIPTLPDTRDDRRDGSRPQGVPHLVRVLDYEHPRRLGSRHCIDGLREVVIARGDRDSIARAGDVLTLELDDPRMSRRHARLAHEGGRWLVEDLGARNGVLVDGAKIARHVLVDGMTIEVGRTALLFRMLEPSGPPDVRGDELAPALGELRTFSPAFERALAAAARVARTTQHVLVHGESGTGKELVARGVHAASGRKGPFVAVNCAALPATLVESELFGYRKGAFSGATEDRLGLVRAADGGTLFLDEIGDMPLPAQAALLRVLQQREVVPVGSTQPVSVDLRVVAASHHDLEADVVAGTFREDLLARVAGFVVELPPLRERREDLGLVIASLLAATPNARISPEVAAALLRHDWPRNVRQLEQTLASALALAGAGSIELEHLPPLAHETPARKRELSPADLARAGTLREALAKHEGNIAAVARELAVARQQIHRWLARYGIEIGDYRKS